MVRVGTVGARDRRPDRLVILRGALTGLAAYAVAYVVTYATVVVAVAADVGDGAPTWKVAGWFLHVAHFGRLAERPVGQAAPEGGTYGLLSAVDGSLALLVLVPPVTTALAGFVLVWWGGVSTTRRGAALGGLVATGYPIGTLSIVSLTGHVTGDSLVAVAVDPLVSPAVVATSVCYPLVFGVVGGVAAAWLSRRVAP